VNRIFAAWRNTDRLTPAESPNYLAGQWNLGVCFSSRKSYFTINEFWNHQVLDVPYWCPAFHMHGLCSGDDVETLSWSSRDVERAKDVFVCCRLFTSDPVCRSSFCKYMNSDENGLAVALFTVTETRSSVIADIRQRRAVSLRTAWLLYVNGMVN